MTKKEPEFEVNAHHVKLLFPKRYLSHADVIESDKTYEIEKVVLRDLRTEQGTERRPVIRLRGEDKSLVLNATNANIIADIHNQPDPTKWPGLRITLYATTCQAFGRTVDCLRVRARKPADLKPSRKANPDAEYLKGHPDRELVASIRRDLYGAKKPLSADEIRQLSAAVRKHEPPAREPGDESDDEFDPIGGE